MNQKISYIHIIDLRILKYNNGNIVQCFVISFFFFKVLSILVYGDCILKCNNDNIV